MTPLIAKSFCISKQDISQTLSHEWIVDVDSLEPRGVVLRIDRFAFTANNVTYATMGEVMKYWRFFPAPEGLGIIPVWGFAEVVASRCDGIETGERFFGYYPMSTHLVVNATQVKAGGFVDGSPHRRELSGPYNQYVRCSSDPLYATASEDLQMLLRPLFMTSFLLDDFFADNNMFEAKRVVLTSASSKTAIGMAHLLRRERKKRPEHYEIVGLTSEGNQHFVESLQYYDRVLTYGQLAALDQGEPTAIADFAGSGELLANLHRHLGSALRYSCLIGLSHWDERGELPMDLPGPKPKIFFAPSQAEKRIQQWGGAAFQQRLAERWHAFVGAAEPWLEIDSASGEHEVARVYRDVLNGHFGPSTGYVLSLPCMATP